MTARLMDRRDTRICFDVPVCVVDRHGRKTLETRSMDISQSGIRIASAVSWEVGTPLTCQFKLGQEKTFVNGKVIWSHDGIGGAAEPSVGIEFVDLSSTEQNQLRGVVGVPEPVSHRVDVRFDEGVVPGQIRRSKQGLQLDLKLDFLARGRGFRFSIPDEGGGPSHYTGEIGHVWAIREKHGVPLASMDVDVAWIADAEPEISSEKELAFKAFPTIGGDTERSSWYGLEKNRRFSTLRSVGLGVLIVGFLTCALWAMSALLVSDQDEEEESADRVQRDAPAVRFVEDDSDHGAEDYEIEVDVAAEAEPESTTAVLPPKGRIVGVPEIEREGDQVTVTVDLEGSLKEASYYRLAEPDAVGVNLPHARVEKSQSYVFHRDGVRLVLVRPRERGAHVRVFFEDEAPKYRVDTQGDKVVIRYRDEAI